MKLKFLSVLIVLSLGACASVPPPPHCEGSGQGMQPINPDMLTQEQLNAQQKAQKKITQPPRGSN